jgi:prepilin-type N-terminal cleavage/methylation domain-containing protein
MKLTLKTPFRSHSGFTLIELLSVIAVVGVLVAILIPAVVKVRTLALRTETASNLRQVYNACILYSQDHKFALPNAYIAPNDTTGRKQGYWTRQLVNGGYLGAPDKTSFVHPQGYSVLGSPIQRRELPDVTLDVDPPRMSTFGMNGVTSIHRNNSLASSLTLNKFASPGRTLFISEGHIGEGSGWFGVSVDPWGSSPNNTDGIITFAYVDGHIGQMTEEEFPRGLGASGSASWYFWHGIE